MAPPTLSLKQRLAALTVNTPASPISPITRSPSFPSPRTPTNGFGLLELEEQYEGMRAEDREMIDNAVNGVITQAGVDYETRPMVVVTAASFPDPRQISYDILLSRIIAYLDLYVENDYVVVFLAAGGRHTPSWNWVWKAYRSMSRKYRKNLKRLLIVHPTWFSKMFVSLAGAVLSPKFFRKITYVSTLSELARYVPLTQIEIAPAVYNENLKHERTITLPSTAPSSLTFGVPLEQLMGPDGEASPVPRVIRDCVEYLRSDGPLGLNLEVEGLFRRSPNVGQLRSVREAYDRGNQVTLAQYYDPHIAAVLIKKFLRDLPEPIFSGSLYPVIAKCPPSAGWGVDGLSPPPFKATANGARSPNLSNGAANGVNGRGHKRVGSEAEMATVGGWGEGDACVEYIREVLLPAMGWGCRVVLLGYIFHLLHDISLRSSVNKMDAYNLALCIAPNLVRSNDPIRDVKMCAVPGAASMTNSNGASPGATQTLAPRKAGSTTLGDIVRVCIDRYFEIFEDVPDRGDALPVPSELKFDDETSTLAGLSGSSLMGSAVLVGDSPSEPSSADTSVTTLESMPRSSVDIEDDELNEAMLVMSVTPEPPAPRSPRSMRAGTNPMARSTGALGPSAWSRSPKFSSAPVSPKLPMASTSALGLSPGKPSVPLASPANRHRRTPSSNSTAFSVAHTTGQNSTSGPGSTIRGARSVISIEKQTGARKGSIALGRSGSAGASGVAAMGVTATGFFERPT